MDEILVDIELRIDQLISKKLQISRNQALNLVKNRAVFIDSNLVEKPSFIPKIGDVVKIKKEKEAEVIEQCLDFDIEVIYEDDDILVLNKPVNLAVHPAKSLKEPSLVEWLLDKNYKLSSFDDASRPGIIHRLDKPTSGALIIAKNNEAHLNLAKQFKNQSVGRYYILALNLPLRENIIIDRPIGRNPKNRLKNAIVDGGRESKTAFLNLHSDGEINLAIAKLFTGRTHQIRVHLSSISRYILGDDLYGFKRQDDRIKRLMLHAFMLEITHPRSGENLRFIANLDSEFLEFIKNKEIIDEKILQDRISDDFRSVDSWMLYGNT
ncbi:MAG: RluA family pseudouridine synthase [Campylobacteraceae bacterium]|nr:RluA family pseudouridine synthase [Campylobacteraceae bacterium]